MNIGIIVNPKSGRNKATAFAKECERLIVAKGHSMRSLNPLQEQQNDQFWESDRLIIIGGDGTVHHMLPKLIKHQIPFFHLATGTSNLIATEFKKPKLPAAAVHWVEQGGETNIDVPALDSVPFLVMCSFGMDAGVIHRFQQLRTGSGGFRNYIRPVIQEALSPRPAHLDLKADGVDLGTAAPANLVLANMRSYALNINPCPDADPAASELHLVVSPCSTTMGWSLHTILNRLRMRSPSSTRSRARSVTITGTRQPSLVQLDGEIASTPALPQGILEPQRSIIVRIGEYRIPIISSPHT